MSAREFVIPVVLGLVAATVFWVWDPEPLDLSRSGDAEVRIDTPYVLIQAAGTTDHQSILLRYNATPRHDLGGILDLHPGQLQNGTWQWSGTDLVCLQGGDCTPRGAATFTLPADHNASAARFGVDGLVADVTFYLFTSSGHLLATNAPRLDWVDYDLHGDFSPFSTRTWWFGEGARPSGAADVPAYKTELRGLLWDTPVGGVQSAVLERHEYDWLVGPVWLTVRVDAVG